MEYGKRVKEQRIDDLRRISHVRREKENTNRRNEKEGMKAKKRNEEKVIVRT